MIYNTSSFRELVLLSSLIVREKLFMTQLENKNFHPVLAILLNWLFPGLGHIILGQSQKGIWIMLATFIGAALCGIPGIFIAILGYIDVYQVADAVQQGMVVDENEYKQELLYKICKLVDKQAIYKS
jgi:TM2 domain-containing membrane protein YozV